MSNDEREQLGEAHLMEHVLQDIKDIKETVHWLVQSKQDKVRPSIFIPFIVYLVSQAFVGVWWASDITASIASIETTVMNASEDRFYGRDGVALKSYIDLKVEKVDLRDQLLKDKVTIMQDRQELLEQRLRTLEVTSK